MSRETQDRPNVIVFFTDQQRWDTTGVHGNPLDLTPNFDRLALGGTFPANTSTCQPVCGPARACLQTGLYASQVGCHTNGIPLPAEARTLAHYFGEAGYDTGYIGKWHLASGHQAVPKEQRGGYDYWLAANILEFSSNGYRTVMWDADDQPVMLPGYRVDALADATIRYIDAHQEKPFFLFTSYIEPHFQNHLDDYPAPLGYRERYQGKWIPPDLAALGGSTHQHIAGYLGMIKRLDEALGRIYDSLVSLRLEQNTIILFTSDHACHFKTRNSEYKRSCHEGSINIPTFLAGGPFQGGGRIDQPVSLVDLPPSLLDAAGIPVPEHMSGRSLLPLARGEKVEDWPEEAFIQISEAQIGRAIRTRRWKYSCVAPDAKPREGRADRYVEEYLYDLQADPYELRNLIESAAHEDVRAELRARLVRRMLAAGETEPEIVLAQTRPSGQRRVTLEEAFDPNPLRGYTQLPEQIADF